MHFDTHWPSWVECAIENKGNIALINGGGGGVWQESENQKLTLNFHRYCEKLTS